MTLQYIKRGAGASEIACQIEAAIFRGKLAPGARLPPVRSMAIRLKVSPTTVAAAYQSLRTRGLVTTGGRRGTVVSLQSSPVTRPAATIAAGVRNLASGNPDPELLPALMPLLARLRLEPRLYGEQTNRPELLRIATGSFASDGIPAGPVAIAGGALDGIERVLAANLRPGDRVALEDPGYYIIFDLVKSLGLIAVPVAVDDSGPIVDSACRALSGGARALILTPRAQNPTGAALDKKRTAELTDLLRDCREVLLIEDDHAGPISGVKAFSLATADRPRWAVVRSITKFMGPDLRLAFMTGDEMTIGRVERRRMLGTGWVSHILQQLVVALWSDEGTSAFVRSAADTYNQRRMALIEALASHGIAAAGRSGLNVWIPVLEEFAVVQSMLEAGWAIAGGERYRIDSPPAVRVTTATMRPAEALRFAEDLARALGPRQRSLPA